MTHALPLDKPHQLLRLMRTAAVQSVLSYWNMRSDVEFIYETQPGGFAVLALLANAAAKAVGDANRGADAEGFYRHKAMLLQAALEQEGTTWWARAHGGYEKDGVPVPCVAVFVEGVPGVGQLAFHLRRDERGMEALFEAALAPETQARNAFRHWDGVAKQHRAYDLARAWIDATMPAVGPFA